MIEILIFLLIILISFGLGKKIITLFAFKPESLIEDFIFSSGLGLGVLAYLVYIAGSFKLLYLGVIIGLLLLCAYLTYPEITTFIRKISLKNILHSFIGLNLFEKFIILLTLAIPSICLFGALAPEIGNDALAYHIFHPKIFIQSHKIGYIPYSRESLWPYLTEMLFTLGMLIKSVPLAKLFHYFFGILSALAVFSFTKRYFSKKEALLACALFYTAPGIFMQSVYAYVDLSLCFYSFMAFYCFCLWRDEKKGSFIALCGIFTGLALSIKLLAGFILIIIGLAILVLRKTKAIKPLILFIIFSALASFIWYLRSYIVLHNPVFPFMSSVFKTGWPAEFRLSYGYKHEILGIFTLPWDLVMHIDSYGGEQIGIIFLVFLPAVFFLNLKNRITKYLIYFALAFTLIWFLVDQNIRFFFVNYMVIYILIACGLINLLKQGRFYFVRLILAVMLIFNLCLCIYYNRDAVKLKLTKISIEEYLNKYDRAYPVAEFVNKNLPQNCLIVADSECRGYYFDRIFIGYFYWMKVHSESLVDFAPKQSLPVYFLSTSESVILDQKLKDFLLKNKPIFQLNRELDEKKMGTYLMHKLN